MKKLRQYLKRSSRRQKFLIIAVSILALFIYNPPVCIGPSAGHFFMVGPLDAYSLHTLAERGKLPLVALSLIITPWRINAKNKNGETPLHRAAAEGNIWTIKFLVYVGADVNSCTRFGATPFKKAFNTLIPNDKRTDMARFFIKHGLELNPKAIPRSKNRFIMEGGVLASNNSIGPAETPPLSIALDGGNLEIVKLLIERGANVNPSGARMTPIMAAVLFGDIEIINYMIENGADVNFAAIDGTTPLMALVKNGKRNRSKILKLLLDNGANVNAQDEKKLTALHHFFSVNCSCSVEDFTLLIQSGANLNAQDERGDTFLHLAFRSCGYSYIQLAIKNNANLSLRNKEGLTPKDVFLRKIAEPSYGSSPYCEKVLEIINSTDITNRSN